MLLGFPSGLGVRPSPGAAISIRPKVRNNTKHLQFQYSGDRGRSHFSEKRQRTAALHDAAATSHLPFKSQISNLQSPVHARPRSSTLVHARPCRPCPSTTSPTFSFPLRFLCELRATSFPSHCAHLDTVLKSSRPLMQQNQPIIRARARFLPLLGGEGRGEGGRFTDFAQPYSLPEPAILRTVSRCAPSHFVPA
jgi:hypothetical protein